MTSSRLATILPGDRRGIVEAAATLRRGGLVAFPTETVYGLGADARNDRAIASLFATKRRPKFNPLIVHVGGIAPAETLGELCGVARELALHFWPGPLTLVVRRQPECPASLLVSAGLDTIALRVPSHPVARELLSEAGLPIAAPSANISGRLSATAASHVREELGNEIELVLDGGFCPLGLESTVVGFEDNRPILLRHGAIPRERIEALTGPLSVPTSDTVRSPGQSASHYAPRARIRMNATSTSEDEVLLAFGNPSAVPDAACAALNLSPDGDLREAAANLYAMLRTLDAFGTRSIAVMRIPGTGLGEAINDRLTRAAAPRATVP
jgi:L-threonylcarbamoyladenylate synthase